MNIGQRIREVREDLGMQAAVLARRTGVAPNTIYRIEAGDRTPSVALLEKIARELRTVPSELLAEEVITFPPGAVEEVLAAHRAGKISKRDAQKAIADLARSGPGDPLDNAAELLLEYAEGKRAQDREGAEA